MNTQFSVGEMARLNNISKQTLIYYDNEGVFKPKIIDPQNGYRYYTADQLEVLDSILILKEMGLSLSEIKNFMKNRNGKATISLMEKQYEDLLQKIERLKLISKRLQRKMETLKDFYDGQENMAFITCDEEYLAIEPVDSPKGLLEVDFALKRLLNRANQEKNMHYYQIGDMVSENNFRKGNYVCFEYAFLPLEEPPKNGKYFIKQRGIYARAYHSGAYSHVGKTYERLLKKIEQEGYRPLQYSFEYCVLDSLTSQRQDEYVTEIQISVEKITDT